MDADHQFQNSTLRERIVEHVFVGEALRTLWRRGVIDCEVLRTEFDAHGYDLVMGRGAVVRHIQFKTGISEKPLRVSVSAALAEKPSGCVVWIRVTPSLDLRSFFWFGNAPGEPLASIRTYPHALRPTRNRLGERPVRKNHHNVPGRAFTELPTIEAVLETMFGPLPQGQLPA